MPSIEQLAKLLEADPTDAFVLYGLAQEHAKQGRLVEALAWYDRVIGVDRAYCYAYFHKAKAQHEMGDRTGAEATIRRGLDAARASGDRQALGELGALLDDVTDG